MPRNFTVEYLFPQQTVCEQFILPESGDSYCTQLKYNYNIIFLFIAINITVTETVPRVIWTCFHELLGLLA